MRRSLLTVSVVGLIALLSACRPGPIDPPVDLEVNRQEIDLSNVTVEEGSPLDRINIQAAWSRSTGKDLEGRRVKIGLVGTGVDYTNPDIRNAMWVNSGELSDGKRDNNRDDDRNGVSDDLLGYDFADGDGRPYDWHGFDTYIAGLLVGAGQEHPGVRGMAPNAELVVARYLNSDGRGNGIDAAMAIYYVLDQGAKVVYLNWPNGGFGRGWDDEVVNAIEYASSHDAIVVLGAGNNGNQDVPDFVNLKLRDFEHVLIVSAQGLDGSLTSYTNYGRELAETAAPVEGSVSYTAGGHIQEAMPSSAVAAAYVTGVAALLSTQPGLSRPKDIRDYILNHSKVPDSGRLEVLAGGSVYVAGAEGS